MVTRTSFAGFLGFELLVTAQPMRSRHHLGLCSSPSQLPLLPYKSMLPSTILQTCLWFTIVCWSWIAIPLLFPNKPLLLVKNRWFICFWRLTRDVSKHSDLSPAKDQESSEVLDIVTRHLTLGDPQGVRLVAGGLGHQRLGLPPRRPLYFAQDHSYWHIFLFH